MRSIVAVLAAAGIAGSAAAQSTRLQPISLAKVVVDMPVGAAWEHLQGRGLFGCVDQVVRTWEAKDNGPVKNSEFERSFRSELGALGFVVSGDPTNLFQQDERASDLQVGARIMTISATVCETGTAYEEQTLKPAEWPFKGTAFMRVEWQVYSVSQAKVLARISTEASFEQPNAIRGGAGIILARAFGASARAFGASEAFKALLAAPAGESAPAQAAATPLSLTLPKRARPLPLDQAAKAVVSIFAGEAMGSGVLISSDGYILTNHHVAGESDRVRVHWPDGSDTVGQVVRSDRARDVALIQTTPKAQPLPIRHEAVKLGESVFAIGTPREKEFAGTLTKGVVSTPSRLIEGHRFIQSDVAITHGNSGGPLLDENGFIVGLTDLAYEPQGVSQNINFFIPIDDALRALALTEAAEPMRTAAPAHRKR